MKIKNYKINPDPSTIKMPRGKHKGEYICDLPTDYLLWIAENWSEKSDQDKSICMAADIEYQDRV